MLKRRRLIQGMLTLLLPWRLRAGPAQLDDALAQMFGARPITPGGVVVEMPPLVENGNAVPLTVRVTAGPARQIHVFNEKNPQPHVISVTIGPGGRGQFSTRIKLADSQRVIAVAELADGSLRQGEASVVVTVAACIEEGP